ncbi:MAG: DUF1592 domain-containing protein [Gemmataceae bacterium]|nr:DUF1592 domain-containing protein [Gemmataceae bacterium]
MDRRIFGGLCLLSAVLVCLVGTWQSKSASVAAQGKGSPALPPAALAYLAKHCYACHGAEKQRAGLALHVYQDEAGVLKDRKRWNAVVQMVTSGEMPPPERPRPKLEETEAFLQIIGGIFEKHDRQARRDPGRVTMRRLNRTEYNNTIRDLVGVDFNPADDFPADDVGYGFDNIGDVLTISPLLMERYLAAAEAIIARAIVVGPPPKPGSRRVIARFLEPAQIKDLRFRELTKDRLHALIKVSQDGEYTFRVKMYGKSSDSEPPRVALLADDKELKVVEVKTGEKRGDVYEAKLHLKEGANTRFAAKLLNPGGDPPRSVSVEWFELFGPADPYPATHRKLLATTATTKAAKTRDILGRFASKAYRRPATPDEIERLAKLVEQTEQRGESWEAGIGLAMQAVLCSPKFLFRVELDDRPDTPDPHPIDDYQLACRLSYFLWSSMPDDELFALAASKQLHANIEAQVRRMLKDPKSAALIENFSMQWLQLRPLRNFSPDPDRFPEFNDKLRNDMLKETQLFFGEIVREDRSILDLIDSNYSFVNERLAKHYGIPYPGKSTGFGRFGGNEKFEKVIFKTNERGGLLTQASILTVNSNPTRTNPVKRGKWVLEQLLGTPPPPPPPNVPELPDNDNKKELKGTLRQRLEQHRKDPACANCHAKMDPLGLAFENYNAIGKFRTTENGEPIDPSGSLPNGQTFKGPQELKKILLQKKELFARCLVEKMLIYGLGRGLDWYDKPAVDQIVAALAKNDYRFQTMVVEIAKSDPFRLRRGKDQDP